MRTRRPAASLGSAFLIPSGIPAEAAVLLRSDTRALAASSPLWDDVVVRRPIARPIVRPIPPVRPIRPVPVPARPVIVPTWRRPAAYWWRPGAVAARAAIGFVGAAAAAYAGSPSAPG